MKKMMNKHAVSMLLGLAEVCTAFNVAAQEQEVDQEATKLPELVVSATRREESIAAIPSSVTVLRQEEIAVQASTSNDLGDILGKLVPGMAPSTETLSNFGQPLRGRNISVLIDGVPQSTPLRNILRDLRTIDPSAVERIEIIRGATAIYGFGATGGIVNFITKKPTEKPMLTTQVGGRFSLTHPGDSLAASFKQAASGTLSGIGYGLSAQYERTNSFFDAEGDRIPPDPQGQGGLADLETVNLFGKIGSDFGQQRLELMVNHFDAGQDTDFVTVNGIPGQRKATARRGTVLGEDPDTVNTVANLSYKHQNLFSNRLNAQFYYQNYASRFGFVTLFPGGGQSILGSEKLGSRLDIETPLPEAPLPMFAGGALLWGADYLHDRTAQPLEDGRVWVPPIRQGSVGLFAQLEFNVGERLVLRGGVRHEFINLEVDDFTTLFGGNPVRGGELDYDATVFNGGAIFYAFDAVNFFTNFSQGFSVADVGNILRSATAPSVRALNPEAQKVDNYEIGVRGEWRSFQASLSVFLSTSDLGTTFGPAPEFRIVRSPERIYGLEASADVQPTDRWRLGSTLSLIEGKRDSDLDGDYDKYLPGDRILPMKLTAYVEHQILTNWRNRLQLLHSGSRGRFPGSTAFGEGEVESFTTVDLISTAKLGPGTLRFGVENLLNEQYFPPISQWHNLPFAFAAGQGAVASLQYSIEY
jgi:iron complex outermembrane recepter protein